MTDLRLTPLGYGAASIGNHRKALSDETARAVLEAAWDAGVRHFDTAPHYGLGLSERRLGEFLASRPRGEYVVSTKVGRLLEPREAAGSELDDEGFVVPATHRRVWDFSVDGVRRSAEESLTRLGLDAVDILYLHDPERWDLRRGLREGLPAVAKLRAEGLTRAVGVGSMRNDALVGSADSGMVDVLMVAGRYTLADHAEADVLLEKCHANDVAIVAAAVFNGGLLAAALTPSATFDYQQAPPDVLEHARRLRAVCDRFGVSLRAAALQFPLRDAAVKSVVVGGTKPEQVRQNAEDLAVQAPPALWDELRREGLVAGR